MPRALQLQRHLRISPVEPRGWIDAVNPAP
jgi:hypothetical protein